MRLDRAHASDTLANVRGQRIIVPAIARRQRCPTEQRNPLRSPCREPLGHHQAYAAKSTGDHEIPVTDRAERAVRRHHRVQPRHVTTSRAIRAFVFSGVLRQRVQEIVGVATGTRGRIEIHHPAPQGRQFDRRNAPDAPRRCLRCIGTFCCINSLCATRDTPHPHATCGRFVARGQRGQ